MKLRTISLLFAAVLSVVTFASAQKHYENSAFTADYPLNTEVKLSNEDTKIKSGESITLYEYAQSNADDTMSFMVMINDYPASVSQEADAILTDTMHGVLSSCTDRTNFSSSTSHIGSVKANQFQFVCNDDKLHFFFYIRQAVRYNGSIARLYQVIVVTKEENPAPGSAFANTLEVK